MDTEDDEFRRNSLKRLVERLNNPNGRGGIARLARELEIAPTYVSRMLAPPDTNQRRPITGDMVLAITKLYPDWLSPSPDTQPARNGTESYPDELEDGPRLRPARRVPVVGEVQGGSDGYLLELEYPVGHGDGQMDYHGRDPEAYALRVRGDSMYPRYRAGEFVIVEPNMEPQCQEDVVVILKAGQKMLKMLNWITDEEAQFLSINDGHKPLTIPRKEIDRMQRVAGHVPRSAFIKS